MAVSILKSVVSIMGMIPPDGTAHIVLSGSRGAVHVPIIPAELPKVTNPQNNEIFKTVLGDISIIGTLGLRELTIEGLLPSHPSRYPWISGSVSNATQIITFLKLSQESFSPIRVSIVYENGSVYLNMQATVDEFDYYADNARDFHYRLKLTEYRSADESSDWFGGLFT